MAQSVCMSRLGSLLALREAGEVLGRGEVGRGACAGGTSGGALSTVGTVSTTAGATVSTVSTTRGTTASAATATTGSTSVTAVVATGGLLLPAKVDVDDLLGLALTLARSLTASALDEIGLGAGEGLALGELLAGALVGLAGSERSGVQSGFLLELLSEVLLVGLGVVLLDLDLLTLGIDGSGVGDDTSLLLLGAGIGKSGLLIVELGLASLSTPAVGSLLLASAAKRLVNRLLRP